MNILVHICCAPCVIYTLERLRKVGHLVGGFFYNPNIHPYSEYLKRKEALEKYSTAAGLKVTYASYDIEDYFQHIVYNEALKTRCPVCWWLRVERTAEFAKGNGFDAFTTTLLASPYQEHKVIANLCEDVAKRLDIKFYYEDFRIGFKDAHSQAKAKGIYCQNYCGCIFSEKERIEKKGHGKCSK